MAIKSYAWFWVNHWRGDSLNGACYDVDDTTNYQVYQPGSAVSSTTAAVRSTWLTRMTQSGKIFEASFCSDMKCAEPPANEFCGQNSDGLKMSQVGTKACAISGKTFEQILLTYYYPGVSFAQVASARTGTVSDVSGDGFGDILATKTDGTLNYYPNNIKSNPTWPFGSGPVPVGSGWQNIVHFSAADISGDGYSDIVATKTDGYLYYYPNNIKSNPSAPFAGGPIKWGGGWSGIVHFSAADVSGDGYADILAITSTGELVDYPNNVVSNPQNAFTTAPIDMNVSGLQNVVQFAAGDVSGDGYADLLVTTGDGNLYYYPNNIRSNPTHPFAAGPIKVGGPGWQNVVQMAAVDVSGDDYSDILATMPDGSLKYYPNNIKSNPTWPFAAGPINVGNGWQDINRLITE